MTQKTSTNGHELTDEQKKIICTSKDMERGETILITACAGSGKTFTLTEVAKANPGKKFLYLAYNKSAATDATKKFPGNVEVRTVHSAAYKAMVSDRAVPEGGGKHLLRHVHEEPPQHNGHDKKHERA